MTFTASLRSEFLKVKRTSIIYLVLIAAFVIPLVLAFDHDYDPKDPANGWDNYYREGFMVFVFVFLPLFFVLASTLLMQIEVKNNTWKQVLASPQSYFNILIAKFSVIQAFAFLFVVVFNIYMLIGAVVTDWIFDLSYLTYLERWPELLKANAMAYGATLGVSALGFWLALRSKNFITPIAVGFLLWLFGPTIAFEFKWPHADKYVYALPFTVVSQRFEADRVFHQLLSVGYGVLFFGLAYLEFVMKRMKVGAYFLKK
ncbi:MAG TPA: ABC transporter permease [Cyclobacteriaceae bacterium]|nr:ABC transporter permease [Cyclobacteriaceae bacterium]